jgi:hypothetical protein
LSPVSNENNLKIDNRKIKDMKIQKTKNEILLDLLERKDWIIEDKIDCLREYQEWVMNAPYKIMTLVTISMILEKVISSLPKEK